MFACVVSRRVARRSRRRARTGGIGDPAPHRRRCLRATVAPRRLNRIMHVAQLADVPRPACARQDAGSPPRSSEQSGAIAASTPARDLGQVGAAAKWRQGHADRVQPVEQVGTEPAVRDRPFQRRVGAGDQQHVDLTRTSAADGPDHASRRAAAAAPIAGSSACRRSRRGTTCRRRPRRRALGLPPRRDPVNAPSAWPNSSASIRVSGQGRAVDRHERAAPATDADGRDAPAAPCRCPSRHGSGSRYRAAPPRRPDAPPPRRPHRR